MDIQYNATITSDRIKSRTKEIGLTLSQLNSICKLSENTIKNAGKSSEGMKAKNLFTIAEVLDCSVDYLLGRTDKPKPEAEVIKDNHGSAFIGANVTELPVTIVQSENHQLDEMQKELLSRFGELPFTEKLEFMKELVEKTKNEMR